MQTALFRLIGLKGNDKFIVDNTGDVVIELFNQGADTVESSITYILPMNVEDLLLTGTSATNGSGNNLANQLKGNQGKNSLFGGTGNDTLNGADSNDVLVGGTGKDSLIGGNGADRFDFDAVSGSGLASTTRDIIADFKAVQVDKIDLSTIDAKGNTAVNDAFTFIGTAAFSGSNAAGQLRFDAVNHVLLGSTDADNQAEFSIGLTGVASLVAANFIL